MKNAPKKYCSKNEFSGYADNTVISTKTFEVTTSCNIDDDLLYFKVYRFGRKNGIRQVCRIFLDKPEYFYSDFYLTKKEKEELLSLLPNIWDNIIKITNEDRELTDETKLIDTNLIIPNYTLLETEY